ncbi:MAG: CMP-2-keto-3-deoxyoctulosonic acid synthetase, partial [Akkermansiaceae bacterium]
WQESKTFDSRCRSFAAAAHLQRSSTKSRTPAPPHPRDHSGIQAFRHSGIQAFRHSGIQAFRHLDLFLHRF